MPKEKYKKICYALGIQWKQTMEYVELIKSLNPRPNRGFGGDAAEYIIPDLLISCHCGEWEITLNDKWIGSVGINKLYKSYVNSVTDENVLKYLRKRDKSGRIYLEVHRAAAGYSFQSCTYHTQKTNGLHYRGRSVKSIKFKRCGGRSWSTLFNCQ